MSDFNASQEDYKVEIQSFPQDSYNDAVTAAASAEKLPCILDVDGPIMPSWAWGGYLAAARPAGWSCSQINSRARSDVSMTSSIPSGITTSR